MNSKVLVELLGVLLLTSCGDVARFADVQAPTGAVGIERVSEDGNSVQDSFVLAKETNDASVVEFLDPQLQRVGLMRCDHSDNWSDVHRGLESGPISKLVRIYVSENRQVLAVLALTQRCDGKSKSCEQQVVVRQVRIPREVENARSLVESICAGTALPPQ